MDNLWKSLKFYEFFFLNAVISYKLKEYEFDPNLIFKIACGKLGEKFALLIRLFHVKHLDEFIKSIANYLKVKEKTQAF